MGGHGRAWCRSASAACRDLEVVAADINPRVVAHLRRAREHPPRLRVATSLRESPTLSLSRRVPSTTSTASAAHCRARSGLPRDLGNGQPRQDGVRLAARRRARCASTPLDIVTERLAGERFDLIVATNILPYFDDPQLALAVANIAAMLAPGGAFLHNEQRPDHRRARRRRWACRCSSRATPSSPR